MKPVERNEILDLAEYEKVREHFRNRVILEKKTRRVSVGPYMTLLFENHDTVLLQIQEMLRTERITRESSVAHEIETYNELLGGPNELGATLMIEIPDAAVRDAFLVQAKGIEKHVVLRIGALSCRATWDPNRASQDQASAVTYLKFPIGAEGSAALKSGAPLRIVTDHPDVALDVPLPSSLAGILAEDIGA
jgi:hypothetical protein